MFNKKSTIKNLLAATLLAVGLIGAVEAAPTLAERHVARGTACAACHVENPPAKPVPTEQCQKCHGNYEAIAARTDEGDINPHQSHLGEPDCTNCHKGHSAPQLMCAQCHQFKDLKVP